MATRKVKMDKTKTMNATIKFEKRNVILIAFIVFVMSSTFYVQSNHEEKLIKDNVQERLYAEKIVKMVDEYKKNQITKNIYYKWGIWFTDDGTLIVSNMIKVYNGKKALVWKTGDTRAWWININ